MTQAMPNLNAGHNVNQISDKIKQFNDQLNNAEIHIDLWYGRTIRIANNTYTFDEVSKMADNIYQDEFSFVHNAYRPLKDYIKNENRPLESWNICRGKGGLLLLPLAMPFAFIESAGRTLESALSSAPAVKLSTAEEAKARDIIKWRKEVDSKLQILFEQSQDTIRSIMRQPVGCCSRFFYRRMLSDDGRQWQQSPDHFNKDESLCNWLVEQRIKRETTR